MSDVTQRSGSPIEPDGVPPLPDSVRAELERILASKLFVKSERLGDFLRFVVDRAIQGEADRIKEWVIGVEAFGRAESFDPRVDPAVRIAARQLRYKLREYYATDGKENPIEIDLPKGSYTPIFRSRPVSAELPRRGTRWKSVALGCIALIVALAAKTVRGDGAGLWIGLDLPLAIGVGIVLISSIGVGLASFSRRASAVQPRVPPQQDVEHLR